MVNTSVNICGIELKNPIIPASGTFGFGYEFAELYDINKLGSICLKGTTKDPRYGNDTPRIAECSSGMLNSVGLQNPGIEKVISEEIPRLRKVYSGPITANVSGFSKEEFVYCSSMMDADADVDIIEINISCPNVHNGGMSFGTNCDSAYDITKAVKSVTHKPVIMKLSPNVTDISSIAKACEDGGADGISLINTLMGMRINLKKRTPLLANITGGLSGPAVFPVALRMVWQVFSAVKIPIIGLGGISSAEDVIEMMMCGASAVQIGAQNLVDPYACSKIIDSLPDTMIKYGITDISEIVGGAH